MANRNRTQWQKKWQANMMSAIEVDGVLYLQEVSNKEEAAMLTAHVERAQGRPAMLVFCGEVRMISSDGVVKIENRIKAAAAAA
jgi:hypothetical protein